MTAQRHPAKTRTQLRSADTTSLPLFASALRQQARPAPGTLRTHTTEAPTHLTTGLAGLDRALRGGLAVGEATLVAARHQVGATSLLMGAALVALKQGRPVAYFSERLREEQIRGRLVILESRVNGHRIRAGFTSAEDRIALAAARDRLAWNLLSIAARPDLDAERIEANIFSYRPSLALVDVRPRPSASHRAVSADDSLLAGVAALAAVARRQEVALVVRLFLAKGNHVPDLLELPGLGAAALPFGAVVLLHREHLGGATGEAGRADDGEESTGTSSAEARVVRVHGAEVEPRVVPLRFDQRFAGLLDA